MSIARINHVMLMIWGVFAMHHLVKLLTICPSSRFNAARLRQYLFRSSRNKLEHPEKYILTG